MYRRQICELDRLFAVNLENFELTRVNNMTVEDACLHLALIYQAVCVIVCITTAHKKKLRRHWRSAVSRCMDGCNITTPSKMIGAA